MAGRAYRFVQVDVFTERPLAGNALAVVLDAEGIADDEMQAVAREMNLSETTFVLPPTRPECAAKVRIFTPGNELPFAGHPTIGTACVLAREGLLPAGATEIALEEGAGPVPVRLEGDPAAPSFVWMTHGEARFGPEITERAAVAAAIGLAEADLLPGAPVRSGTTGVEFLYVPLRDKQTVDRAAPDARAARDFGGECGRFPFYIFAPDGEADDVRLYSRMFGMGQISILEDPATGGACSPLGAYLVQHGLINAAPEVRIVSEQGTTMGRRSLIHIRLRTEGGRVTSIEVGGSTVPVMEGTLFLP